MTVRPIDVEPAAPEAAPSGNILADLRASADPSPGPDAEAAAPRPRRRFNIQTLVLALVLVATTGALYLMRNQSKKIGLRMEPVPIEKDLSRVRVASAADERRMRDVLQHLVEVNVREYSVPEKPQNNPFVLEHDVAFTPGSPDADADARRRADLERAEREKREQDIRSRLAGIVLTSVMEGPTPVAYVSSRLVKVGDTLEDYFTVAQIHDRSIDLMAEGKMYTVRMSDNAVQGGGQGRRPGAQPPRPPAVLPGR